MGHANFLHNFKLFHQHFVLFLGALVQFIKLVIVHLIDQNALRLLVAKFEPTHNYILLDLAAHNVAIVVHPHKNRKC